jgi:hypothetical protein
MVWKFILEVIKVDSVCSSMKGVYGNEVGKGRVQPIKD